MVEVTEAELDRLVKRNNRYIASLRGENELKCGNGMASFALEESTTAITTLRARIAELEGGGCRIKHSDGRILPLLDWWRNSRVI